MNQQIDQDWKSYERGMIERLQSGECLIDPQKLAFALDAYKVPTSSSLIKDLGFDPAKIRELRKADQPQWVSKEFVDKLAVGLRIHPEQLRSKTVPDIIFLTKEEISSFKITDVRGGRHVYNYYPLPRPFGVIGPVMLDILVKKGESAPLINKGHREPANSIVIGDVDIIANWSDQNGYRLEANRGQYDKENIDYSWITGASYTEKAFEPHGYEIDQARQVAHIISYTCNAELMGFMNRSHSWGKPAFEAMLKSLPVKPELIGAAILDISLKTGKRDLHNLAEVTKINIDNLSSYMQGEYSALSQSDYMKIGFTLGTDYTLFMQAPHDFNEGGRTHSSIEDSIKSIRKYGRYEVASCAQSSSLPGLVGNFIKVDVTKPVIENDLLDLSVFGARIYYVTSGTLTLSYRASTGVIQQQLMQQGDSVHIAPCLEHGFSGKGSLIELGSSEMAGIQDLYAMRWERDLPAVLAREHGGSLGWAGEKQTASINTGWASVK